jgi:hypothetical protein
MILLLVGLLLLGRVTVTITWTRKGGDNGRAGSGGVPLGVPPGPVTSILQKPALWESFFGVSRCAPVIPAAKP